MSVNNYIGNSNQLNLNSIVSANLVSSNISCENISVGNNPGIGQTIIGLLPATYYNNPFSETAFLMVDLSGNYIALPTASNCILTRAFININNLGPGAGGVWAQATAGIRFGTSLLATPAVNATIAGGSSGAIPFNATLPITAWVLGTNNYTGTCQFNHPNMGTTANCTIFYPLTTATAGNNYLSAIFTGAVTPGTNNAIGTLSFYLIYFNML